MASRKEEQAKRRAERLEAERRAAEAGRRRMILGYVVAGALTLAVVIGLVVALSSTGGGEKSASGEEAEGLPEDAHIETFFGSLNGFEPDGREGTPPPPLAQGDLDAAASEAGCDLRLDLPDEGAQHLGEDDEPPDYGTNPPTSGSHIDNPLQQADGAYSEFVEPVYWVHSLEHGRIAVQYDPDLPEAEQLEIKGVFDESPEGMLLFPNPEMPYEVAATAWTELLGCERYEGAATLDAIRDFRDIYRGQGPEAVALSP